MVVVAGLTACGDSGSRRFEAPPSGFPWLGTDYTMVVEITGTEGCGIDGQMPAASAEIEVELDQLGTDIAWTQTADADGRWKLEGRLCALSGGHEIALRGAVDRYVAARGRDRVESSICVVETRVPAADDYPEPPADPCGDPDTVRLVVDACGGLSGAASARLSFGGSCETTEICVVEMNWTATVSARRQDAPAIDPSCPQN